MNLTLGFFTINNARPQVLQMWLSQITRLRTTFDTYFPAVVTSGAEDRAMCQAYHVHHYTMENKPVTRKWNKSLEYLRTIGCDYCMVLGSDDFIDHELISNTVIQMKRGYDVIGVTTLYFYCAQGIDRGKLSRLDRPSSTTYLGVAKTISSKVLDQCDWKPWNEDKNWGMDSIASKTIKQYAKTYAMVEGMVVDVKTKQNMNSFNVFKRYPKVAPQEFYNILSGEEITILNSL
jgi:hypothetical protein